MTAELALYTNLHAFRPRVEQRDFTGWRAVPGSELAPVAHSTLYVVHRVPVFYLDDAGVVNAIEGADAARAAAEADFEGREGTPAGSPQNWQQIASEDGLRAQVAQWWQMFGRLSCITADQHDRYVSNDSSWFWDMQNVPMESRISVEATTCDGSPCERRTINLTVDEDRLLATARTAAVRSGVSGSESITRFAVRRIASGLFDHANNPLELSLVKETTIDLNPPELGEPFTQIETSTSTYRFRRDE